MSRKLPHVQAAEDRETRFKKALRRLLARDHGALVQGDSAECYRCGASGTWDPTTDAWSGTIDAKDCK